MAVYLLERGKYRVRIFFRGVRRDFVVNGTKADAEAFEARKRLEFEQESPTEVRVAPTFSAFCVERYSPHARQTLAPSTWTNRTYQLATIVGLIGDVRLDRMDAAAITRFIGARQDAGMAATTINDDLKVIKKVLNYAKELEYPVKLPKFPVLKSKGRKGRVKYWNPDEVARLYASCERHAPDLVPLLVFLVNTGCRKTEVTQLRWESVDFKNGVIWIEPNAEWTPKDNEARQVPMNALVRSHLERLRVENKQRPVPSEHVFTSRDGTRWAYWPQHTFDRVRNAAVPEAVREQHEASHAGKVWNCQACRAFAPTGGPHSFRHTFASLFLAGRPDLFLLSKILGHSSERTTLIYAHMLPGAVASVAEVVSVGPATAPAREGTDVVE